MPLSKVKLQPLPDINKGAVSGVTRTPLPFSLLASIFRHLFRRIAAGLVTIRIGFGSKIKMSGLVASSATSIGLPFDFSRYLSAPFVVLPSVRSLRGKYQSSRRIPPWPRWLNSSTSTARFHVSGAPAVVGTFSPAMNIMAFGSFYF